MSQSDKIALITGGNRGLGFETARALGELGITVIIGARDQAAGEEAVANLAAKGITTEAVQLEITNPEHRKQVLSYLSDKYGRLDILVNNAGVFLDKDNASAAGPANRTSETSEEILRRTFDTNFFATVALTQELLPLLKKAPSARIVNLSSILGSLTLHSDPTSPIADSKAFAYNASKTALNAFTVHLAHELKSTAIKVNSAHPGWVRTAMGGENATLAPEEGGRTSARLATLDDSGPTGGYFHLDQSLPW
ncbi:MAG: fabG 10 [Akkermansiaceae bacterium]|nr:fabG 10 [Akkermansiaceae bacterium]